MTAPQSSEGWKNDARNVRIEDEIARRGIKLHKEGSEYEGPCPICGGKDRFSINVAEQLFNCRGCKKGGDVIDLVRHLDGVDFDGACTTLTGKPRPHNGLNGGNGHAATQADADANLLQFWIYRDENGAPYLRVQRIDRPDGKKIYLQSHWNGSGWEKGKPVGPKIPYRLPELVKAPGQPVFICEGEKCADAVAKLGWLATTASEGAGKWTADLNRWSADRPAYILPDNDEPGASHGHLVASNLNRIAREIRIVKLDGLGDGEDVDEWIEREPLPENLLRIAEESPLWNGDTGAKGEAEADPILAKTFSAADLCAMTFEPIKEIVPGFVAEGLTLFAGKPKIGKSWLLMHAGWAVADGNYTLGGISCEAGDVLYAALEDNKRRLQRRMTKLFGAVSWPKRLTFVNEMPRLAEGGLEFIKAWIESARNPRLAVIDTLAMVRMPNRKDQNSYDADYAAVKDLRDLAAKHGVAIVLVHHLRKAEADDPFDTISGTLGLTGAPDTIMIIYRESGGILLQARGRDIEEIKKAVEFDKDTCLWTITGDADVVRRSAERSAIIKAMEEAGGSVGPREIADALGMKAAATRQTMSRMKKDGLIRNAGKFGKYELVGKATEPEQTVTVTL